MTKVMVMDESDSENCNANGELCTDNFDCCSSACDMNSCVEDADARRNPVICDQIDASAPSFAYL